MKTVRFKPVLLALISMAVMHTVFPAAVLSLGNDSFVLANVIDKPREDDFHYHGDVDWFKLYGVSTATYSISATNLGSNCDIVLELYADDRVTMLDVANLSGYGSDETLSFTPTSNGTYYVRTRQNDTGDFGADTGYILSCENTLGYDAYEKDDTHTQAKYTGTGNGEIKRHNFHDGNDEDWIFFIGLQGRVYTIETRNPESLSDTIIELYQSDGTTRINRRNIFSEGFGERMDFPCPADGNYYVRIANNKSSFYGENTGYDLIVFYSNAPFDGKLLGIVTDACTNEPIEGVSIKTGYRAGFSVENGGYLIQDHEDGTWNVTVEKPGYQTRSDLVYIQSGFEPTRRDWELTSTQGCTFSLDDLILTLRIMAGLGTGGINDITSLDKDGDGTVAIADSIFILQKMSGQR